MLWSSRLGAPRATLRRALLSLSVVTASLHTTLAEASPGGVSAGQLGGQPVQAQAASTAAPIAPTATAAPAASPGRPAWWIGSALQMDTVLLPGGDVCGREGQSTGRYACFRQDGEQYLGAPAGASGEGAATLAYGTTRILLHAERSLLPWLSAGGRLGIAFGGGPQSAQGAAFMPLHMEGRVAFWVLGGLDSEQPLNLFVTALGGLGQVDASRKIAVEECQATGGGCTPASNEQPGGPNPVRQELDAYVKLGQGFAGLGFGVMYRFFGESAAVADLRAVQTFPSSGTSFSLSLSYVVRAP